MTWTEVSEIMPPEFAKPSASISSRMKRVHSRGTTLETKMQDILKRMGVKYEAQPNLLGHPDFRISETKVLVFCDSSFFHGRRRADVTGESFKRNREFWTNKIVRNRQRDKETNKKLKTAGWTVLRFWDTSILKRPELVEARILKAIQ
jgi:DNA mismatch endonuclease (patch repair protein)